MRIDWAPLSVPVDQRLQTLSAAVVQFLLFFGQLFGLVATLVILIKGNLIIRALLLLYLAYIFLDRHTADNGGRPGSTWFRSLSVWRHFANYFPSDLVRTVELPPDRNYLFALFPHGVMCLGAFCNFNSHHSKFKDLFPGIRARGLTLGFQFNVPFFREAVINWGMASASGKSLRTILGATNDPKAQLNRDGFTSNAAIVAVGGAAEAFFARPKNYTVVLRNRKGFVRIAMQSGSPIVPMISFNEVDIYDQAENPPGSKTRRFQEWVKRWTGVTPVLFFGRGMFQYTFGLIPHRRPITTVVGAPLEVPLIADPRQEQIDDIHTQFCEQLTKMFEEHKFNYIEGAENVQLVIQ